MDGNKKIRGFVIVSAIALTLFSCRVQTPTYVGLYVDNSIPYSDSTTYIGEVPLDIVDTTTVVEAEPKSDLYPAKEMIILSSDSVYQHEVKSLLKWITDSVQPLRHQVFELQKQLAGIPDTSITREKQQVFRKADSLQKEPDFKQLVQKKNDTITMLRNQVNELKKYTDLKADTVYIAKEIVTQFQGDSIQADHETIRLLKSKDDTILSLRKQVNELQSKGITKADTVYVIREKTGSSVAENQQNDQLILQLLRTKDEQINNLQNQVNSLQNASQRMPQQTQISREPAKVQPLVNQQPNHSTQQLIKAKDDQIQLLQDQLNQMKSSAAKTSQQAQVTGEPKQVAPFSIQQTDLLTLQMFQAKNDTIQFLRDQLHNLQLLPQIRDTVYIEKEIKEVQPVKEIVVQQKEIVDQPKETGFQSLHDTISLLKSRVLSLEEQIIPVKDTIILAKQDEKDEPLTVTTDTTLLVAYYLRGKIKPIEEEKILQQIKELYRNKIITNVTLSGYTDSSGDKIINKEITNRRLNYISEMIIPWIAKDKIFFQNFGDVFASDVVIEDERRVEIRIYTK